MKVWRPFRRWLALLAAMWLFLSSYVYSHLQNIDDITVSASLQHQVSKSQINSTDFQNRTLITNTSFLVSHRDHLKAPADSLYLINISFEVQDDSLDLQRTLETLSHPQHLHGVKTVDQDSSTMYTNSQTLNNAVQKNSEENIFDNDGTNMAQNSTGNVEGSQRNDIGAQSPDVPARLEVDQLSHHLNASEHTLSPSEASHLAQQLNRLNEQQRIVNQHLYGPVLPNTTILLVQVHNRLVNLYHLVRSMAAVRGMQEALVVFSHDVWQPQINAFLASVTAFRFLQIFFPFSVQLYPNSFPGRDPHDCDRNATQKSCVGDPDTYGHYREPRFTQIKHHWWWKLHSVFEVVASRLGLVDPLVVLLEEDHYLAPDLLHALRRLQQQRQLFCPSCHVLALGNYQRLGGKNFADVVKRGDWEVNKHNLGFVLDASTWGLIRSCTDFFCDHDDYNWDWTLREVGLKCVAPPLSVLATAVTRVLHVGSCGTHVKKAQCNVKRAVTDAKAYFEQISPWLFPARFRLMGGYLKKRKDVKPNGGWGDSRDRRLCKDMVGQELGQVKAGGTQRWQVMGNRTTSEIR